MTFHVPENCRVIEGTMATSSLDGNNGAFMIKADGMLRVIASDGMDWEHVSVSRHDRCPSWDDMAGIKALFWDAEDCVIQYHPPESQHVNYHPYCLHLWRPIGIDLPVPPSLLVGPLSGYAV